MFHFSLVRIKIILLHGIKIKIDGRPNKRQQMKIYLVHWYEPVRMATKRNSFLFIFLDEFIKFPLAK